MSQQKLNVIEVIDGSFRLNLIMHMQQISSLCYGGVCLYCI